MRAVNYAKRYGNAKGDWEEARHFVASLYVRRDAKRALRRARRRLGKMLCA